jgi:hypothetical protein
MSGMPISQSCPKVIRLLDNIVRWLEFIHKVEFAISDKDAGLLDKKHTRSAIDANTTR